MDKLTFIDPRTGAYYEVLPTKVTIDLAYKLGYMPATLEDEDAADKVTYDR